MEATLRSVGVPDAVWVPAFRQNDFRSARKFADKHDIPLIFDPLISAWDKSVFERKKYAEKSFRSLWLLSWERSLFSKADLVIADTELHAEFFVDKLGVSRDRIAVIPVGAEEPLFTEQLKSNQDYITTPEILFYGSFISLQGPEVIVDAAMQVPEARWTLLGNGPLRGECEERSRGHEHICYEEWHPYDGLPTRIGRADVLLGIFGNSEKSGRVIPNKVYQSLACGRPVVTRSSEAYPLGLQKSDSGIVFVPAADENALADAVRSLIKKPKELKRMGGQAVSTYRKHFSEMHITQATISSLAKIKLYPESEKALS
ncbi:glycosyltransferase [Desulfosediminicola flagellatus]|uniref:glycosyltransferase n=1 Tax=Desulfosediminicola flagellatus TaxID=2569541 RepID=UPI00142EBE8A|nr:glycosyltransferase [Desulfosediminicola flagellatus]